MNLYFHHLSISPHLTEILQTHAIKSSTQELAQVCIFPIQSVRDLLTLKQNTLSNLNSEIILVVPQSLFRNKHFQTLLFSFSQPALVLNASQWESELEIHLPLLKRTIQNKTLLAQAQESLQQLGTRTNELIQQFERDLELASSIQKTLIPSASFSVPGVQILSKYLPASGLGGDYFDVFELHDKKALGFLMADSKTHGMAAALLSALLKIRLEEVRSHSSSFSTDLISHLNDEMVRLRPKSSSGLDLFFGVLDRTTLTLDFTSAGALRPKLWTKGNLIELSTPLNPPAGEKEKQVFHSSTYSLRPGDLLFLNTNGLEIAFEGQGVSLHKGLSDIFHHSQGREPLGIQNELLALIDSFKEKVKELPDDITWIQLAIDQKTLYLAQSR